MTVPVRTETQGPGVPAPAPGALPGRPRFPGAGTSLVLYFLCTLALTWPLAVHLTDRLPAGDNDLWQNYWNFWWWRTVLLERGQSPYSTDILYQPGEVSLALHTHSEANVLGTLPVSLALGVPAALNTAILLGFVLSAWGGYFLARELVGDRRAAFLGGIVIAFFPHRFEQSLEHLNLASYQAMPFFLLFLLRLARSGGWSNVVLTAATFALNALLSWHNALLVLFLAATLFAHELWWPRRPRRHALRDVAAAGLLAAAALLPFAWPMLREILSGDSSYLKPPVGKAIDPLFLIVPAGNHPLWGKIFQGLYDRCRTYPSAGFTCYLGLAALGLWAAGGWPGRRTRGGAYSVPTIDPMVPAALVRFPWGLWSALLVIHIVLAMGDTLTTAGTDTGIPLPFAVLRNVPAMKTVRLANRFVVPAMIALGVLAAHGTALLGRRWGTKAIVAAIAIVVADFLWIPYPTRDLPHPPFLDVLANAPPGLLLDIPGGHRARGAEDMYFQTIHRRPIVGGYVSCIPPAMEKRVEDFPFLKLLFEGRPQLALDAAGIERELRRVLGELPVSVVVLHLDRERERLEARRAGARGTPLERLSNPEKGTAARVIGATRDALRRIWGPPLFADGAAEVYGRP